MQDQESTQMFEIDIKVGLFVVLKEGFANYFDQDEVLHIDAHVYM